ncbi:hypothetical protein CFAM422_010863 [Trichoderma lentiforme]|uniref:Uncharacterized protein n=1 Tax=Trichoderma lentiforme TaxID=1567552 RepID=A0A9P5C9X3_9HYPO|nr:hypothetical protein CFAM422_010863 [Trichoderma lentiforme]
MLFYASFLLPIAFPIPGESEDSRPLAFKRKGRTELDEFPYGGFDLRQKTAAIWDDGNNRSSMSTLKTIAQAIIQIFTDPTSREEAKNQYIRIATATTTRNEILQALERVSGTKFQVTRIETAEGSAWETNN